MGEDVKYLLRGDLSSQCLQEKKGECFFFFSSQLEHVYPLYFLVFFVSTALVSAVSVAVEAILAQFSSSRTVVQKVSLC